VQVHKYDTVCMHSNALFPTENPNDDRNDQCSIPRNLYRIVFRLVYGDVTRYPGGDYRGREVCSLKDVEKAVGYDERIERDLVRSLENVSTVLSFLDPRTAVAWEPV